MNAYAGTINPQGVYVRALYDYEADDHTSLSFRQGDIIQVLTQLESGWWDGVIHGYRGWFPSNYCEAVDPAEAERLEQEYTQSDDGDFVESDVGEDDHLAHSATLNGVAVSPPQPTTNGHVNGHVNGPVNGNSHNGAVHSTQEEEAFWIPQATPDGRLFYFNTLTGVSTMELPLQSPDAETTNGRGNRRTRESSRPAPELMAGGYEIPDAGDSEPNGRTRASQVRCSIQHCARCTKLTQ